MLFGGSIMPAVCSRSGYDLRPAFTSIRPLRTRKRKGVLNGDPVFVD